MADFSPKETTLEEKDALPAFTDQITDAFNKEHISFGNEHLQRCVTERGRRPAALFTWGHLHAHGIEAGVHIAPSTPPGQGIRTLAFHDR